MSSNYIKGLALFCLFFSVIAIANDDGFIYKNYITNQQDNKKRASIGYMLHRAWVQIFGIDDDENKIEITKLDIELYAKKNFAVAWLGHDTLLIKSGKFWTLTDPIFSSYATPFPPFGPKRLAELPLNIGSLPHIDFILISHDHYDHLDLETVKKLANQEDGSPLFLVGRGLASWFLQHVPNAKVEEMVWWDNKIIDEMRFHFVPAQHSSGRSFFNKNLTLWGGWIVEHNGKKLYFAGDTAFEEHLFRDIKSYVGEIELAALPVGAYLPEKLMQYEHMSPDDATNALKLLAPKKAFGIHWGTYQLGDDTSDDVRKSIKELTTEKPDLAIKLLGIGQFIEIGD